MRRVIWQQIFMVFFALSLFTDCSDGELDFLYRRARALVFPSHAEGFGLPLVEARQRGCAVLASRIPVFEEQADAGVRLFSPESAVELAELMLGDLPSGQPAMAAFSWGDSSRQFLDRLAELLPECRPATVAKEADRGAGQR